MTHFQCATHMHTNTKPSSPASAATITIQEGYFKPLSLHLAVHCFPHFCTHPRLNTFLSSATERRMSPRHLCVLASSIITALTDAHVGQTAPCSFQNFLFRPYLDISYLAKSIGNAWMSEHQTNNSFGRCHPQSFCGGFAQWTMRASSYSPTRGSNRV